MGSNRERFGQKPDEDRDDNLADVLLLMRLTWLEVEVVLESEKVENMEQIEVVAIGGFSTVPPRG